MANDHGDDLRALKRVIGLCRVQATELDMPALSYILDRAETSVDLHQARAPQIPRGRAVGVPRDRIVRH